MHGLRSIDKDLFPLDLPINLIDEFIIIHLACSSPAKGDRGIRDVGEGPLNLYRLA